MTGTAGRLFPEQFLDGPVSHLGPAVFVQEPFVVIGFRPGREPFVRYPHVRELPQENPAYVRIRQNRADLFPEDRALSFL